MNDNLPERDSHEELEELLPWYANGRLDRDDRAKLERHLESCSDCRAELALDRRFVEEFQSFAPEAEAGWARIRQRIEPQQRRRFAMPQVLTDFWDQLRQPGIAALAAAQLAFLVIGGALFLSLSRPAYHALGSLPAPAAANILVIFRADATVEDVRDTLLSAGAEVVGGPTPADAYLLTVPAPKRAAAVRKLQSDQDVQLAQPIDGPTS